MFPSRRFDRSTSLFLVLLVVSFLIATFDVRSQGDGVGASLREGAQAIFSPVQQAATAVARPVAGFIDGISNIAGLRDEVERLRDENAVLSSQLLEVASLQNRLEELTRINDLAPPGQLPAVTARISSLSPSEFDQIRWIDKGSSHGVALHQAVIDEDGLVGRIDYVAGNSARVRLISDPRLGVGVRNLATNETGLVEGLADSDGVLQLKMFDARKVVSEGDRLVTDGTRFPPGISVGKVAAEADPEVGFTLVTTVDPSIRLSELDYVKVVVGWSPLDVTVGDEAPGGEGDRAVTGQ